jgi:hypothetical protein
LRAIIHQVFLKFGLGSNVQQAAGGPAQSETLARGMGRKVGVGKGLLGWMKFRELIVLCRADLEVGDTAGSEACAT